MKKFPVKKFLLNLAGVLIVLGIVQWWQTRSLVQASVAGLLQSLSVQSMDGATTTLKAVTGERPAILYFWAPWCGVCHLSISNLESVQQTLGNKIQVVAIALDWEDRRDVEEFIAQHALTIPIVMAGREMAQEFHISAYPTFYSVGTDGHVRSTGVGYSSYLGLLARAYWLSFFGGGQQA